MKLTARQAANLLNVSVEYLDKLLNNGEIPFVRIGKQRQVETRDVLAYKRKRDVKRETELANLIELTESYDGYDDEI